MTCLKTTWSDVTNSRPIGRSCDMTVTKLWQDYGETTLRQQPAFFFLFGFSPSFEKRRSIVFQNKNVTHRSLLPSGNRQFNARQLGLTVDNFRIVNKRLSSSWAFSTPNWANERWTLIHDHKVGIVIFWFQSCRLKNQKWRGGWNMYVRNFDRTLCVFLYFWRMAFYWVLCFCLSQNDQRYVENKAGKQEPCAQSEIQAPHKDSLEQPPVSAKKWTKRGQYCFFRRFRLFFKTVTKI